MAIRHTFDLGRNLVTIEPSGTIDAAELLTFRDVLCGDPQYRDHLDQLWDFGAVDEINVDHAGLSGAVERQRRRGFEQRMRCALVVPQDVAFGLGRMYEAMTAEAEFEVGVFRDRASALEWLSAPAAARTPAAESTDAPA